ncbi:unnamed protein product, partial [Mesorhabditis spiculigera]
MGKIKKKVNESKNPGATSTSKVQKKASSLKSKKDAKLISINGVSHLFKKIVHVRPQTCDATKNRFGICESVVDVLIKEDAAVARPNELEDILETLIAPFVAGADKASCSLSATSSPGLTVEVPFGAANPRRLALTLLNEINRSIQSGSTVLNLIGTETTWRFQTLTREVPKASGRPSTRLEMLSRNDGRVFTNPQDPDGLAQMTPEEFEYHNAELEKNASKELEGLTEAQKEKLLKARHRKLEDEEEKNLRKTIVFDIESALVERSTEKGVRNYHHPTLLVALRSCVNCRDWVPSSTSDSAECHEYTMETSYDGLFFKLEILPQMRYLSARFVDSLNFLPMPLSDFAKAFNLPEEKGYFPHGSHTFERLKSRDRELPPSRDYYPKQMSKRGREAFMKWYLSQKERGVRFNIKRELEKYCLQDVVLLHKGVCAFADAFLGYLKVDPFAEATTIASSAMKVFRKLFVNPKLPPVIALTPEATAPNQSMLALNYLEYLRKTLYPSLRHAGTLGGEVTVGTTKYKVDGYVKENTGSSKRKLVFEVYGCYYHLHECKYTERDFLPGRSWAEVKTRDRLKREALEGLKDGSIQHGVLSQYIDMMLQLKTEASGFPDWVFGGDSKGLEDRKMTYVKKFYDREGVELDIRSIRKNPELRQVAKLLANSLWGKMGQRSEYSKSECISDPVKLWKLLDTPAVEIVDLTLVNPSLVYVKWKDGEAAKSTVMPHLAIHYAALTTTYARLKLLEALEAIPPKELLYTDTDSIIFRGKRNLCNKTHPLRELQGDYLGQLVSEVPRGYMISQFVTQGPKCYAYVLTPTLPNLTESTILKLRGFRQTWDTDRLLNFDAIKRHVEQLNDKEELEVINVPYSIIANEGCELYNYSQIKKFGCKFEKRMLRSNYKTLPFGY